MFKYSEEAWEVREVTFSRSGVYPEIPRCVCEGNKDNSIGKGTNSN